MKSSRRVPVLLLVLLGSLGIPVLAAPHPARPETSESLRLDAGLVHEILRASGISDEARRGSYEATLGAWLTQLREEIGARSSDYRKAKKLHQALHARLLRRYEAAADGLDAVMDRGEYNCLSASLLYGLLARAFGLEAQIVQIPSHVYVRLYVGQRSVEVESTSRGGFDLRPRPETLFDTGTDPGYFSSAAPGVAPTAVATVPEGVD